jgi:hypothetical protein
MIATDVETLGVPMSGLVIEPMRWLMASPAVRL